MNNQRIQKETLRKYNKQLQTEFQTRLDELMKRDKLITISIIEMLKMNKINDITFSSQNSITKKQENCFEEIMGLNINISVQLAININTWKF